MATPILSYQVTLIRQDVPSVMRVYWTNSLPLPRNVSEPMLVLQDDEGSQPAGLYVFVWSAQRWRLVMDYNQMTDAILAYDTVEVRYEVLSPVTLPAGTKLFKNSVMLDGVLDIPVDNSSVWGARKPAVLDGGDVKSVNNVSPDNAGNVALGIANIPNLQTSLDSKLTQVISLNTDGLSLVDDEGTTDTVAKLLGIAAYDGLYLTADPVRKTVQVRGEPATNATPGVVKIGNGLVVATDGTVSAVPYTLPIATTSMLGGVKQGQNVTIAADGTISATATPYTLPEATTSTLGGLIVGSRLTVDGTGLVNVPISTSAAVGVVKPGTGLAVTADGTLNSTISQGLISVDSVGTGNVLVADDGTTNSHAKIKSLAQGANITITAPDANTLAIAATVPVQSVSNQTGNVVIQASDNNTATGVTLISDSGGTTGNIKLKRLVQGTNVTLTTDASGNMVINAAGAALVPATKTTIGGVIIGNNIDVDASGTISYTLPQATTSVLGGVIVGANLAVNAGTISAPIATSANVGVVKPGTGLTIDGTGALNVSTVGGVSSVNAKTGAVVITGIGNVTVDNSGSDIVISSTGIADAPNDNNLYGRKNQAWALMPDVTNALVTINNAGTATGNVSLVFNAGSSNAASLKALVPGTGVSLTDDGAGNVTVSASANGFVTQVNGKNPDGSGVVTLTPADIGALALTGGVMSGSINMNNAGTVSNLPAPVNPGDAVPYNLITGMTIDNGTYA